MSLLFIFKAILTQGQTADKEVVFVHMISDTLPTFLDDIFVVLKTRMAKGSPMPGENRQCYVSSPILAALYLVQQHQMSSQSLHKTPQYESGVLAQRHPLPLASPYYITSIHR